MCQKCDPFQEFVGASPKYPGAQVAGSDARREVENRKSYSRCYVRLSERADSLKALGSVALFLANGILYRLSRVRNERVFVV
jgi:hypothetical protein